VIELHDCFAHNELITYEGLGLCPEGGAEKFIQELNRQLTKQNASVSLSEAALDWLAKKGYNPSMGARPMARCIHENIKVPLAKKLLFDKNSSHANIIIDVSDDKLELIGNTTQH
jgi:ATP-dependent Clp protease ATP-binding subunit ClpA